MSIAPHGDARDDDNIEVPVDEEQLAAETEVIGRLAIAKAAAEDSGEAGVEEATYMAEAAAGIEEIVNGVIGYATSTRGNAQEANITPAARRGLVSQLKQQLFAELGDTGSLAGILETAAKTLTV